VDRIQVEHTASEQIERLKRQIQAALPGLPAMLRMAPPFREELIARSLVDARPRLAAVLIPITLRAEHIHIVLTKRCAYPGVHSAQISFPGGKMEQGDEHLEATALRETKEELQLQDAQIDLLGALTPLYIPPSNFWVHPYAAVVHHPPNIWAPQPEEVDQVLEPSLQNLFNPAIRVSKRTQTSEGIQEVPGFQLDDHFVWGATAMILEEFLCMVNPQRHQTV
jgi:8-oxo-dGTP pyrophosphatase MutT (NUDIX family)